MLNQTSSPREIIFEHLFKRLGIEAPDIQIALIIFFVLSGLGYSGIRLLSNSYSNRFKYKIISHFRSTILALVKNVKLDIYQAMIRRIVHSGQQRSGSVCHRSIGIHKLYYGTYRSILNIYLSITTTWQEDQFGYLPSSLFRLAVFIFAFSKS